MTEITKIILLGLSTVVIPLPMVIIVNLVIEKLKTQDETVRQLDLVLFSRCID